MFGGPRALAAALARAHMTSRVELLDNDGGRVWSGPASIQAQGTRDAVVGPSDISYRVTVQAMNVYMPPDAPPAGYVRVRIVSSASLDLVGIELVVTGNPIDTEAPYRRAIVERAV